MSDVYYDMYSVDIHADPYPVYHGEGLIVQRPRRLLCRWSFRGRGEGCLDARTYISGKGAILEIIKADIDIPGRHHLRGSPLPPSTATNWYCLHPAARRRARAEDPRVLRPQPRSAGGSRGFDGLRRPDADAGHRHARHVPGDQGGRARSRRFDPAHQRGRADAGPQRQLRDRRGSPSTSTGGSIRPSDDIMTKTAERRVRRRDRCDAQAHADRTLDVHRGAGRRRQRDDVPDRVDGENSGGIRTSGPTQGPLAVPAAVEELLLR